MNAKEQLEGLSKRLRISADVFRDRANTQDRHACYVDVLASTDEIGAAKSLAYLMLHMPSWFPS